MGNQPVGCGCHVWNLFRGRVFKETEENVRVQTRNRKRDFVREPTIVNYNKWIHTKFQNSNNCCPCDYCKSVREWNFARR